MCAAFKLLLPCSLYPPCSTDSGSIEHTATCGRASVISCGQVAAASLDKCRACLYGVMAKIAKRMGDKRSAVEGRQGNQKTPALVRAAVLQAVKQAAAEEEVGEAGGSARQVPEEVPQGGMTDVGLHTGGKPRDTAWQLVREAFRVRSASSAGSAGMCTLRQMVEGSAHLLQHSHATRWVELAEPADSSPTASPCPPHPSSLLRLHWRTCRPAACTSPPPSCSNWPRRTCTCGCCNGRRRWRRPPAPRPRSSMQPC